MRTVHTDEIINNIKEMCIEANMELSEDVKNAIEVATKTEISPLGKQILEQLEENMKIAKTERIPICQDTGMAIVFVKLGQDVHVEGMNLTDAIDEGIRQGYKEGYLRKSVVGDPLLRENTNDNTPGIIHYEIVSGENIEIVLAPKGFGSENMSRIYMLKPADGIEGVKNAVLETVKLAGPNACPPIVVGVGIGRNDILLGGLNVGHCGISFLVIFIQFHIIACLSLKINTFFKKISENSLTLVFIPVSGSGSWSVTI